MGWIHPHPMRESKSLTESETAHSLTVMPTAAYAGDPLAPVFTYADGPDDAALALLVVSPLASEAVGSRRALVQLVRALAARGHGAVLIDPRGTGESAGEPEDVTFEALCDDLRLGLAELGAPLPGRPPAPARVPLRRRPPRSRSPTTRRSRGCC